MDNAPTREFIAIRDQKIFNMRASGLGHEEIAKALGITLRSVKSAIERQTRKLNNQAAESYMEVLRLELSRLDKLQAAVWPLAQHRKVQLDDGQEITVEPDLKAVETLLKISGDRRRLLGLDAAQKVNIDVGGEIKHTLHGVTEASQAIDYRTETRALIELMMESRILDSEVGKAMMDRLEAGPEIIDVTPEEPLAIEASSD